MKTIPTPAQGTTEDPIRRRTEKHDMYCAYKGCDKEGTSVRVTSRGSAILYCNVHYNHAFAVFDK